MSARVIRLNRGFDIKLKGSPDPFYLQREQPKLFALKPTDVHGIAPIPKLHGTVGDEVKAGDPLFFDKPNPRIQFCAPVSGEIVEVRRGAKRAISEVVLLADSTITYKEFGKADPSSLSRSDIVERMLNAGAWVLMRQRPYNVLADPDVVPRAIYVSCFNTAPLGPNYDFVMKGQEDDFQAGLNALRKLTDGAVHLGVSPTSADIFAQADGVEITAFDGPHPAGNVGIHIHHTNPIAKGEVVWVMNPQDVSVLGRLFTEGIFDPKRTIAVTGDEVKETGYFKTRLGASVKPITEGNLHNDHVRYISGNVLTGTQIQSDGFIGLYEDQVTVIEEGDEMEFMGWLLPTYPRPSLSKAFLSYLFPNMKYKVNTNTHGEERAYVVTGQYERVTPMDMFPQHLVRSIVYRDFDQMEGLGIYEVVEEDLALCEFVCTSKQPVQQILREGLDAMRLEG